MELVLDPKVFTLEPQDRILVKVTSLKYNRICETVTVKRRTSVKFSKFIYDCAKHVCIPQTSRKVHIVTVTSSASCLEDHLL